MSDWVVRAGTATSTLLMKAYRRHLGAPNIFGFSVQYAPGKSIDELAYAGQFPHASISYALDSHLAAALLPLTYGVSLVRTPGVGYHTTFVVLYDATGQMLKQLPYDAAEALSETFQQAKNPHRVKQ